MSSFIFAIAVVLVVGAILAYSWVEQRARSQRQQRQRQQTRREIDAQAREQEWRSPPATPPAPPAQPLSAAAVKDSATPAPAADSRLPVTSFHAAPLPDPWDDSQPEASEGHGWAAVQQEVKDGVAAVTHEIATAVHTVATTLHELSNPANSPDQPHGAAGLTPDHGQSLVPLLAAAQTVDAATRAQVAQAIGQQVRLCGYRAETQRAIAPLAHLSRDTDVAVRQQAIIALGAIPSAAVIPHLTLALRDTDPEVVKVAREAIARHQIYPRPKRPLPPPPPAPL